jgi:hypothetical protein
MNVVCPCCRQTIENRIPPELLPGFIRAPLQQALLRALIKNGGSAEGRAFFVERIYNSTNQPEFAFQSIGVSMGHLKRKLEYLGWTIVTQKRGRGNRATFVLTPLGASISTTDPVDTSAVRA